MVIIFFSEDILNAQARILSILDVSFGESTMNFFKILFVIKIYQGIFKWPSIYE